MDSMMMNAKKKALMALIKKMRGMEACGMADEDQMKGDMPEGEESGEEVLSVDPSHDEIEEEDNMEDQMKSDKNAFFKKSSRLPAGKKTMSIALEMRSPRSKSMKKLG